MNLPFKPMHGGCFEAQRCGLLSFPKWLAVGEFYIVISSFIKPIAPKVDHLSMCGDSRIAALIHGAWSMNGPPLSFTEPPFSLLHGEWFSVVFHAVGNVTVTAWRSVWLHGEEWQQNSHWRGKAQRLSAPGIQLNKPEVPCRLSGSCNPFLLEETQ